MIQRCEFCDKILHECSKAHHAVGVCIPSPEDNTICINEIHTRESEACTIPRSGFCLGEVCQLKAQLASYKIKLDELESSLEDSKVKEVKLIAINNTFRNLMIGPSSFSQMVKSGQLDNTQIRLQVAKARVGFEALAKGDDEELDTVIMFQSLCEKFSLMLAQVMSQVASRTTIKKENIQRTQRENEKALRVVKNEEEEKFWNTAFGKAVRSTMKTMKCSRENAEKMVESLGLRKS